MTRSSQMEAVRVGPIDLLRWNPKRAIRLRPSRLFRWTSKLPFAPRVSNFGDVLSVNVVRSVVDSIDDAHVAPRASRGTYPRLGAVGSIMHMLPDGAVVWGSGVNGKSLELPLPRELDVRAVRGPLTHRYLAEHGIMVPEVYGDPGLLLGRYWQHDRPDKREGVIMISNMNDRSDRRDLIDGTQIVSPLSSLRGIVQRIRGAELVVGSSLHAVVIAESFGVPARAVLSEAEPRFKYDDYYEGTGRSGVRLASSLEEAIQLGGVAPPEWDANALLEAFPIDLLSR